MGGTENLCAQFGVRKRGDLGRMMAQRKIAKHDFRRQMFEMRAGPVFRQKTCHNACCRNLQSVALHVYDLDAICGPADVKVMRHVHNEKGPGIHRGL
jgi:hypothetical protein